MILKKNKKNNIVYNLISKKEENISLLGNFDLYIPKLMDKLWKSPKSIATILLNTEKKDLKKYLAHFIVHDFYYNLSPLNYKEDQLIYIITILLKNEISSLKDINGPFITDSKCGIILEEINEKKEVKQFFKKIILNIIKYLETSNSSLNICFELNEINDKYEKMQNKDKNNKKNEEYIRTKSINYENKNEEKWKLIYEKYFNQPFNKEELNKKLDEYKDNNMKDFINKLILFCESSPQIYLNNNLFNKINSKKNKDKIINYFINSFIKSIDIFEMLLDNLLKYSDIIPYSIKSICKIIFILINKKFPNAIKVEKNRFLVNFFFNTLFYPILMNPTLKTFINEFMISEKTLKNFKILLTIVNNITLGELFEQPILTPFNWYIVEKMPKIIEFFDNTCKITLSPFIDKFLKDELPENYEYDYFKENPEEDILYRNIIYNLDELNILIINAEKCKDNISIDNKILSRFKIKELNELKNNVNYKECATNDLFIDFKKEINFFLLTDVIKNDKYKKILKLLEYKNKHFSLNELKVIESYEEKIQNSIIKIKNCFYALLYNYETISKYKFKKEKMDNIINILGELKKQSFMNSSMDTDNNYIPSNWYIDPLIQYLPKLPKNLIENDYEKLLDEIENEITNSIKELNLEELNTFLNYSTRIDKEILYYKNIQIKFKDLEVNELAIHYIKSNTIILDLKSEDKIAKFFMQILKEDEFSKLFYLDKNSGIIYNSIKQFINKFPNLEQFYLKYELKYFEFLNKKKVVQIINTYIALIKNNLKNEKYINGKNYEKIYNKISDYIMENLYDKLFPRQPSVNDMEIFQSCNKHIWIKLTHLFKEDKNYILDNYLPDSINYIKQFGKEKSPRKKLLEINNLFGCINNLNKLNGKEMEGVDDEFSLLIFTIIKSKPPNIYTNSKYVEFFLDKNKKEGIEGNLLTKIISVSKIIKDLSFNSLYNIDESDYIQNCEMVSQGIYY